MNWAQALTGLLSNFAKNGLPDTGAPRRLVDQVAQWVAHLSQNAIAQWGPAVAADEGCSFCSEDAVAKCICCQDWCCLAHAHVNYQAEVLCDECVDWLLDNKRTRATKRATKRGKQEPRPRTRQESTGPADAFAFFNLTPSADFETVTAVYRARARDAHPDKGGNEQEAAKINQMYQVLKRHFEARAA